MGERIRALWERLREDIHRNPGLWIGVGITAIVAVIAYLAYRKANGQGVVPANGYGFPDYGSASGGSDSSGGAGYAPNQPISTINPAQPASAFTPTSSGVSVPATAFPPFTLGGGSFGLVDTPAVAPSAYTVQGSLQNPLAWQTLQHTGAAITSGGIPAGGASGVSQFPTISTQLQHTGATATALAPRPAPTTSHPATSAPAPSYTVPTIIPTTIRPITVTTKGRVA